MKLVQPTFERTLARVRLYSEDGVNHPHRIIRTIPYTSWVCPLAPRKRVESLLLRVEGPERGRVAYTDRATLAGWINDFREQTRDAEFTASDLAEFLCARGWAVAHPEGNAGMKLRQMYFKGDVREVRRISNRGRAGGGQVVWQFMDGREAAANGQQPGDVSSLARRFA